ncbi:Outer membrane protein YfgL, lipoprotein component of the protein assembly complex (forms a complex with YaeT, YfiO, and NlpB) [invertebrate metagenome]|uniref:Outer membrane protein YfgL, lipoprotein component of the protein assembly complex (Forms a complex with YaeT, YfiO, and NlpB) n=1 Tax=invertebrate metagenome TaxID=1711999 RepID=A0A484H5P4_9ZZZZ
MLRRFPGIIAVLAVGLAVAACDRWLGRQEESPLEGKRIFVLTHEQTKNIDVHAPLPMALPLPRRNKNWPQSGGYAQHVMHHLEIADSIRQVWRKKSGRGVSIHDHTFANFVVAEGRIYMVDAEAVVHALDSRSGTRLWKTNLVPEGTDILLAGGIAADENGRLFVTTGWGDVVALRSDTGTKLWRCSPGGGVPMRAAPTISGSRVFIVNKANEVRAIATESGDELWHRRGMAEITTMLGGAAPAVEGNAVVAALSSGELVVLRAENGKQMWHTSVATVRRIGSVANLSDILAPPVVNNGQVYVVGHSGLIIAINLRSGQRLWEVEGGGVHQPWIAGNFVFLLTNDDDLVALEAQSGRVLWITELPRWEKPEDLNGRIYWTGPILAGDRLVIANWHGKVVTVSPYTGSLLSERELQAQISLPPVVADGAMYFLTKTGELIAYQ